MRSHTLDCLPLPGEIVEFYYPASNEVGIRPRLRLRRLLIRSIRDLALDPLSPADIARRPVVRRGRFLLTGLDLAKNLERSFYLDWNHRREFEVLHSDGEPAKISSGPSRFERLCFGDICSQIAVEKGFSVAIKRAA